MKHRPLKIALLALTFATLFGCGGSPTGSTGTVMSPLLHSFVPESLTPSVSSADGGTTVTYTVQLDQVASGDQVVTITSSPAGSFSSIPATVTVPSGTQSASFCATLMQDANGDVAVTATKNNQSRTAHVTARAMWGT